MRELISAAEIAEAVGDFAPTPEQTAVIEAPLTPGLVVAGAGSGKTTTMAARVVYLVLNELVEPEEVLGLTFTRKAARELAERVRAQLVKARLAFNLPEASGTPAISTYDSFAGSLVRDHALRIGADPDAALITRAAAWQIMSDVVQGWTGELEVDLAPTTVVDRALNMAGDLRANLLTVAQAREELEELLRSAEEERTGKLLVTKHRLLAGLPTSLRNRLALLDLVEAFEARKRELSVVDYSDQVAIAYQLGEQIASIGEGLRMRHRAVLLDEFQDTSFAQLGLLANLFGRGHAVTAVGDPNQAIYSWRGASADSLDGFREAFRTVEAEVPVYSLATSWRNDQVILDAANVISGPLREKSRVHVEPLAARPGVGDGRVTALVEVTEAEEAAAIARWLAERWQVSGTTAAVLVRARRQFTPVLHALREAGLPAEVVGLSGLLRAPEIVDLRSALVVASDASRGDAMMRLLTNSRLGVADLTVLQGWARELAGDDEESSSIVEAVDNPPPEDWRRGALTPAAQERIRRLSQQLRRIRGLLSHPMADAIAGAERILGLDIEVAARAGTDPTAARANLDIFAGHADSFAAGSLNPSLGGFLEWLDAAESNERGLELGVTEPTDQAVQVLTVHSAKGLEWDLVAVAGLSESQFPSYNPQRKQGSNSGWLAADGGFPYPLRGDAESLPKVDLERTDYAAQQEELEEFAQRNWEHNILEERRLAYVAVTRARSELLLSASWTPKGKIRDISRFLEESSEIAEASGGCTIAPKPDEVEEDIEVFGAYPVLDPAGERRERLDAAVVAVREASPMALNEVLASDISEPTRRRADLARALLHEETSHEPTAQLSRRLSASAALALVADPEEFALRLRRPLPAEPPSAATLGTKLHEWVENYYNVPAAIFEDDPGDLLDEDSSAAFEELRDRFVASRWAQVKPALVEHALETEVAGHRISGRVDAIYIDAETGAVEIVDWKTGRVPRGDEIPIRTFQLELYRLAYARRYEIPIESVSARLVYLAAGEEIPAEGLTEAQIVAKIARAAAH